MKLSIALIAIIVASTSAPALVNGPTVLPKTPLPLLARQKGRKAISRSPDMVLLACLYNGHSVDDNEWATSATSTSSAGSGICDNSDAYLLERRRGQFDVSSFKRSGRNVEWNYGNTKDSAASAGESDQSEVELLRRNIM
ncbi:hypothetical protein E3P81_04138 [Wallemia ichthyophaga]|nr:hypothetical protein E3P97_04147 [Wallemia ichthyophaga]TIB27625.1 hypothetical protein E3P85_04151 [Wallemia ichthyophaga]TIB42496.1 hypothetical protein E3P82_04145 [Wallemia ichthyophaga]TIB44934.1 hypothetical protein E3P81_04138 [Wallemia ichthyophaga]TIB46457.1 hypothetical protein E3P80_04150 [Wallemia ichthyophaga]